MTVVATVLWRGLVREHRAVRLVVRVDAIHDRQEDARRTEDRVHRDVHHVVAEATAIRPATGHRVAVAVDGGVAAEHAEAVEAGCGISSPPPPRLAGRAGARTPHAVLGVR